MSGEFEMSGEFVSERRAYLPMRPSAREGR